MTGPIKPTGGPRFTDPAADAGAPGEAPRADFREALDPGAAGPASGVESSGELARLADEVRAGRLTAAEAVDALVARALAGPMARGLSPAARAGLETHLRAALAEDPVLGQLVGDLERAE